MPNTYREVIKDGKPRFEVMVGWNRQSGDPFWAGVGLNTARGIIENEQAFKNWVKKNEGKRG